MRTAATSLQAAPGAVPAALCPLIDALGTPGFQRRLFVSVERMIGAGAAAVYAGAGATLRPVLGDWEAGPGRLERHTREFAASYAPDDPAYRAFLEGVHARGVQACLTTAVARDELPHPGHRILMTEAGFSDRLVTLFPMAGGGWFSLHVLRCKEHGPLTDRMLAGFAQAAPVLGSLIGRHLRARALDLQSALAERCPQLTPRERRVCAGLLQGASAGELAARLGIGVASVRTYRKRAYRKLGVGGLPALFQLLFNGDQLG